MGGRNVTAPGAGSMTMGADLSNYQSGLNVAAAARAGSWGFAIVKASQDDFTDSALGTLTAQSRAAGLVLGHYHFLVRAVPVRGVPFVASAAPAKQAAVFLAAARGAGGIPGSLLVLDFEPFTRKDNHGKVIYRSKPRKVDAQEFIAAVRAAVGPGYPIWIYSTAGLLNSFGNLHAAFGPDVYAWVAAWTKSPGSIFRNVAGGVHPLIHQYGRAVNVTPGVDGDAFNGTRAELLTYTAPKLPPPVAPGEEITRWCRRSPVARLLMDPRPGHRVASLEPGTALLVVAGPIGPGTLPAKPGAPLVRYLEVRALAGARLSQPLWVRERETRARPFSTRPRSPQAPPPRPAAGPNSSINPPPIPSPPPMKRQLEPL